MKGCSSRGHWWKYHRSPLGYQVTRYCMGCGRHEKQNLFGQWVNITLPFQENKKMTDLLGAISRDPIGEALGSEYKRFVSKNGMSGLVKVDGDRVDFLAISSVKQGHGLFRKFIADAKNQYQTIAVWEIWNPLVGSALKRYGFYLICDWEDGHTIYGMRWDSE